MSNTRMRGLAILLLLAVSIEASMPPTLSQPSLSYTVDVSISNPRVTNLWDSRANLTFSISGLGDFLNATVQVHSDAANLFLNTFYLHGFYVGTDGVVYRWLDEYPRANSEGMAATAQYSFRGINCEWVDYDVCAKYSMYSSAIKITGSLILDSSAIDPGPYYARVTFVAHTVVTDYNFNNSLSYQVLDCWQAYFWLPWAILAAALFVAIGVLKLRRSRKQVV